MPHTTAVLLALIAIGVVAGIVSWVTPLPFPVAVLIALFAVLAVAGLAKSEPINPSIKEEP